ncbi:hypothetical protein EC973_003765 [Apophysomyces ossiformis]|uniref:C2H2-type domain-containing protein n=1 Tax=Apophysomyces ossiformis TaxID=679940 RepID=A0A8H7EMV5_9FUNG|nr:hypothetical protein EC973_003765 [Apophysomyces ossiformis]
MDMNVPSFSELHQKPFDQSLLTVAPQQQQFPSSSGYYSSPSLSPMSSPFNQVDDIPASYPQQPLPLLFYGVPTSTATTAQNPPPPPPAAAAAPPSYFNQQAYINDPSFQFSPASTQIAMPSLSPVSVHHQAMTPTSEQEEPSKLLSISSPPTSSKPENHPSTSPITAVRRRRTADQLPYAPNLLNLNLAPVKRASKSSSSSASRPHTPFQCDFPGCQKTFTRPYNLKSHRRTHTSERPFACPHCDKRFARQHDRNRHAKLHLGIKPYPCSYCNKAFARHDALNRHLRTDSASPGSLPPCATSMANLGSEGELSKKRKK